MPFELSTEGLGNPQVMLAITLISLGMATVEQLQAIWKAHGVSDADLDAISAEVTRRLARRSDPPTP